MNALPRPGSLDARSSPPCWSTISCAMVRPSPWRPPDRTRLVDVLNEPQPFFRLIQGEEIAYVNKRHVACVALRTR